MLQACYRYHCDTPGCSWAGPVALSPEAALELAEKRGAIFLFDFCICRECAQQALNKPPLDNLRITINGTL